MPFSCSRSLSNRCYEPAQTNPSKQNNYSLPLFFPSPPRLPLPFLPVPPSPPARLSSDNANAMVSRISSGGRSDSVEMASGVGNDIYKAFRESELIIVEAGMAGRKE